MKEAPDTNTRNTPTRRLIAALLAPVTLCLLLAAAGVLGRAALAQDYSRFSHLSPQKHAELTGRSGCASCHRRADASPEPRLPVHKDCTGCHLVQFTAAISSSRNPICTICHNESDLGSPNARVKKFPALASFTAEFDHAQHLRGLDSARPAGGCASCHAPARAAQTIPAGLGAHRTCYECHSPGAQASNFSSCGSCHGLGPYSRTPAAARAYRVGFSHADHGARQRLACESCHDVRARGLPRGRQVSSPQPAQHFSNPRAGSCMTCHNGRRAFGDMDARQCSRCHKGPGFRMRG
jgi:c(7)-type cytochrome triheme protein